MYVEQRVSFDEIDVGIAVRPDIASDWGPPSRFDAASLAGAHDGDPTITDDGLELFFSSNRPAGVGLDDIWVISRPCD